MAECADGFSPEQFIPLFMMALTGGPSPPPLSLSCTPPDPLKEFTAEMGLREGIQGVPAGFQVFFFFSFFFLFFLLLDLSGCHLQCETAVISFLPYLSVDLTGLVAVCVVAVAVAVSVCMCLYGWLWSKQV